MYRSIFLAIAVALVAVGCGDDEGTGQVPVERWQPPAPAPTGEVSIEPAGPIHADGVATFSIGFSLVDGKGRPLAGVPVTFDAKGGGNTIGAPSMTDAGGRATASLASTRAETKQVTVTAEIDGKWMQVASGWVEFTAGAPTDLSFSYVPSSVLMGNAFTVRVAAADEHGNATRAPVEVHLAAEGGTLEGGTTATTNGHGEALFAGLRIAEPGTVRLVASSDDLPAVSTDVEVVLHPDRILSWRSQPTGTTAGESLAPLEVSVLDGESRPVEEPVEVTLALPGVSAERLEGTTRVTSVGGVATFDDLRVLTAGRDFQFVATAYRAVESASQSFTVVPGAPDDVQSLLYFVGAKAGEAGQARVRIYDALGNPLVGETVAFSSDRADVTIDPPTAITDERGEAVFSVYSTVAGSVTLVVAIGDWELVGPNNTITANVPDPTRTVLLGDGQVGVPGAYLLQPIGLEFQDAWGNRAQAEVELEINDGGTRGWSRRSGGRVEWAWRLGAGLGPQTVLARVTGWDDPIVLQATAQSDWPFVTTPEQPETELLVLDDLPPLPLRLRLRDDAGDLIPDAPIEWAFTSGAGTFVWSSGTGPVTSWTRSNGWADVSIATTDSSVAVTARAPGAAPAQFRIDYLAAVNPISCQYQPGFVYSYRGTNRGTPAEGVYRLYADADVSPGIEVQARFVETSHFPGIPFTAPDSVAVRLHDPSSLQANTLVIDGDGGLEVDGTAATVAVGASWTGHPLARLHRVAERRWRLEYDRAPGEADETDEIWILTEGGFVTSAILDVARVQGAGGAFGLCGRNDGSYDHDNVELPRTGTDSLFP